MVDCSILDIVQRYINQIPQDINIKKVYLFGSFAKGLNKEESDIDIALVIKNMNDFFKTQMQLMRLRRNVDLRIEPHPIDEEDFNLSNPFAFEIQSNGVELELDNVHQS